MLENEELKVQNFIYYDYMFLNTYLKEVRIQKAKKQFAKLFSKFDTNMPDDFI